MIRYARSSDTPALRALWEQGFGGEEPYISWYFDQVYRPERTLVEAEFGVIRSALQLAPYILQLRGRARRAAYVVGVVTAPEHRGLGLSSALLRHALGQLGQAGYELALLYTDLPDFYARLGFTPCYSLRRLCFKSAAEAAPAMWRQARPTPEDLRQCDRIYRRTCAQLEGYILRSPENWRVYTADWLSGGHGGLYLNQSSYILTDSDSSGFRVKELGYSDANSLRAALDYAARLAAEAGFTHFTWDAPQTAPLPPQAGEKEIPWVMARIGGWQEHQTPQEAAAATRELLGAPDPRLWIGEMT